MAVTVHLYFYRGSKGSYLWYPGGLIIESHLSVASNPPSPPAALPACIWSFDWWIFLRVYLVFLSLLLSALVIVVNYLSHSHAHRHTHEFHFHDSWITGLYNKVRQTGTVKKAQAVLLECMFNLKKLGSVGGRQSYKNFWSLEINGLLPWNLLLNWLSYWNTTQYHPKRWESEKLIKNASNTAWEL